MEKDIVVCKTRRKSVSTRRKLPLSDRLAGLVVKASASGAEDSGIASLLGRDFSGSGDTSDLKIGTPVATLPGAWHWSARCQYTVTG